MSAMPSMSAVPTATPKASAGREPAAATAGKSGSSLGFAELVDRAAPAGEEQAASTLESRHASKDQVKSERASSADKDASTGAQLLNWLFGLLPAASVTLPAGATAPTPSASMAADAAAQTPVASFLQANGGQVGQAAAGKISSDAAKAVASALAGTVLPDPVGKMTATAPASAPATPVGSPLSVLAGEAAPSTQDPAAAALQALGAVIAAKSGDAKSEAAVTDKLQAVETLLQGVAHHGEDTAAAAALSAAQSPVAAAATTTPATPAAPVAGAALSLMAADFVSDLGDHIEWQLGKGIHEAKIQLHPAELGALTVRVTTQGDQAQVHIVAAEAATRVLLSQAMPQLRDLLTGSGLNLTRGQVDSDSGQQRGGRGGSGSGSARDEADVSLEGVRRRITQVSLVDAYA